MNCTKSNVGCLEQEKNFRLIDCVFASDSAGLSELRILHTIPTHPFKHFATRRNTL
ncbi:MAG: hypothetical protein QF856_06550 [Candidatus Marinimicrobia bacterium]|jgi:hypothetical protein|nr:hypothetical protein [Candidatus Neomarinimicrobiota bacterium]